jgi:hypothetical protein
MIQTAARNTAVYLDCLIVIVGYSECGVSNTAAAGSSLHAWPKAEKVRKEFTRAIRKCDLRELYSEC